MTIQSILAELRANPDKIFHLLRERGTQFKYVQGYDKRYVISDNGDLFSLYKNGKCKVMIPYITNKGYKLYYLTKNAITKCFSAHRLVATYFIDNPNNFPVVNHINGKKADNHIKNLEWCTTSHNMKEAFKMGCTPWNKGLRKQRPQKICPKCVKSYEQRRNKQIYCSPSCARRSYKKKRNVILAPPTKARI